MSGIAGVVALDGSHARPGLLAPMMEAIAHRGPDGRAEVCDGAVALGHQLLDVAGRGPPMGGLADADGCVVTADCRLDNREGLVSQLGVEADLSDAGLIIAAYRRWGDEAPGRLLGDFAFALWDRARKRLLCARDHFGIKPLYYAVSERLVCFASEPAGVLGGGCIEADLNEGALVALLAGVGPKLDETLHRQVRRLPPAHSAILDEGRLEIRSYWRLRAVDLGGEDPAAGLRRRLETAVAARLRGAMQTGAMLSGGLDSSSIAGLAAPLHRQATGQRLATFSMVFDETPEWNERPHIDAVLAQIDVQAHFLPSNGLSYTACLPELLRRQNGPVAAPNLPASSRIYGAAGRAGVKVVLDGHGGDEVISSGVIWLRELAAEGRWIKLWGQLRRLSRHEDVLVGSTFWSLFKAYAGPARLLRPLKALRGARRASSERPLNPSRFLQAGWAERADRLQREAHGALFGKAVRSERQHHLAAITDPLQAYALEVLDKAAAASGVEPRYPFLDKRVVEFCHSAAPSEKLKGGKTRSLIRRAMAGVLPEAVRNRTDKFDFTPHLRAGLVAPSPLGPDILFADADDGLGEVLRLGELRAAYRQMLQDPAAVGPLDAQALWRFAALAAWWRSERPGLASTSQSLVDAG